MEFSGYHHTSWSAEAGVGSVENIQQAPDGFLWLTTSRGVLRFDGVKFESVDEVTSGLIKGRDIDSVFASRTGAIWLATRSSGMLLWKLGQVQSFPDRACSPSLKTDGIAEALDGSLWIQARSGLAHLTNTRCDQVGSKQGYPGGWVAGILADHSGTIWVQTQPGYLLKIPPGETTPRTVRMLGPTLASVYLHEGRHGSIWLADDRDLRMVEPLSNRPGKDGMSSRLAAPLGDFRFAPDGTLWAGMPGGLAHFSRELVARKSERLLGLAGENIVYGGQEGAGTVQKILADREGTVWIGSSDGLDQFRPTPFHALPKLTKQESQLAVAVDVRGTVYVGGRTLPLTMITGDRRKPLPDVRLISLLFYDAGNTLWIGADSRLWALSAEHLIQVHYPTEERNGVYSAAMDRNGDLWLLLFGGGTYRRHRGEWLDQNALLARKPGVLGAMAGDQDGNIWIAFSNHLMRWNGASYEDFSFPDGALNISVYALQAHSGRVWMAGSGGVVLFANNRFHLLRCSNFDLPGRVTGVLETEAGDLWTNGFSGVTRVPAHEVERWLSNADYLPNAEHFDAGDGLPGLATDRSPMPSLVQGTDGRLWFTTNRSLAWLDPKELPALRNTLPPNVVIQAVRANGAVYSARTGVTLQPHASNLQFDFTALSMAMPDRVNFAYRLDGVDQDWQDAGVRRQAFYTKLSPGRYTFEVRAANNDGVWSLTPATLQILAVPAYYQTAWFRTLCAAGVACLVLLLASAHSDRASAAVRLRMTERLQERERIARELHDTLLQSLAGLMLQFQTAASRLPNGDPTRSGLEGALERSDKVMHEGRERVRYLRSSSSETGQLVFSVETLGQQFSSISRARFRLEVKGRPRQIRSIVQEELLLIVREALANAFTHAHANEIVTEINYLPASLLLSVKDDGCGLDTNTHVAGGRPGHWGLSGMRERARTLRSAFAVISSPGRGTNITVRVPARVVYVGGQGWIERVRSSLKSARDRSA